jgi:flagellar basal-body rod modification protein FlgD
MEVNGVPIVEKNSTTGGGAALAEDFDTFLTLLTTQLQHQDPLSPLDTTEFTNQLTNFAQVEQAINSNKKLDELIGLQGSNKLTTGVGYIGKIAEADGDVVMLQDGQGRFGYNLDTDSAKTTITILDRTGTPVFSTPGSTSAGPHVFDWDGQDDIGNELDDGVYSVLVTALDAEDNVLDVTTTTFGKVTGVEVADGVATLLMGGISVDLDNVRSITLPDEAGDGETTQDS